MKTFLFHYTRSCPGPWPGESYSEYLYALLDNDPLCAHTALDSLARIVRERRLRAGCKLIRGERGAVSFTSNPPSALCAWRRWNRALVRWTAEPYGIAFDRDMLYGRGARPVIYGSESDYDRLPPSEKFRFQKSAGKACSWRCEHEWRLPGDLDFSDMSGKEVFIFIPTRREMVKMRELSEPLLPVFLLEEQEWADAGRLNQRGLVGIFFQPEL